MFLSSTSIASILGIPLYLIFLIASIICAIYMVIYQRNLNKALKQNNKKHISLPDFRSFVIVLLVALLFFGIFSTKYTINTMQENMQAEFDLLNSKIDKLQGDVNRAKSDIHDLTEANKKIDSVTYSVDSYDIENQTITYSIEISLKQPSPDTTVSTKIGDTNINCIINDDGKYVGKLEAYMFEVIDYVMDVTIVSNESPVTEEEEHLVILDGWKNCLPSTMVEFDPSWSIVSDILKFSDHLIFEFSNSAEVSIEEAYLEIEEAGKELRTIDFGYTTDNSRYSIPLTNYYLQNLEPHTQIYVYIVAVDSAGYTHRTLVWDNETLNSYSTEHIYDLYGDKLTEGGPYVGAFQE